LFPPLRIPALLAGLALFAVASPAAEPLPALDARPVPLADSATGSERIGQLRALGLLELPSRTVNGLRLAGLSDLAWDDDDGVLYALSDLGALFGLRPVFRDGRLTDLGLVSAAPLLRPDGNRRLRHWQADGEGLDIANGRNGRRGDAELIVSFEGEPPRVARYRPDGTFVREEPLPAPLRDTAPYRSANKTLESVCLHPRAGLITTPEQPRRDDPEGRARLHALSGSSWTYPRPHGGVVALECLPNGDVLLLERDFQPTQLRTVISLHRLRLPRRSNDLVEMTRLATLDSDTGLKLDNFEGLARHRGNRFFLVSDDNDVFLQRTLLLYVEITDR